MATALPEDALISILQSSTSPPIFSPFSDYLQPFSDYLKNSKSRARKPRDPHSNTTILRPLAKRFSPFLNRCLIVLAKRFSALKPESPPPAPPDYILELFRTYRLCLDCVEVVSSELAGKPYAMYLQSARLLYYLLEWGMYEEVKDVAFGVLQRLRVLEFGAGKNGSKAGKLLPDVVQGRDDAVFARLVVEVVISIVKCLASGRSSVDDDYRKVMILVEEVKPWFRVLDANIYQSKDMAMATYTGKCAQHLVGKLSNFDGGLVSTFCLMTLDWYAKSSVKDQMFKFSCRTCSSLFLFHENMPSVTLEILSSILNSLACECKVGTGTWQVEFIDFVSYCASKCQRASTIFCSTVADRLNDLADNLSQVTTPTNLFIRLYSIAMCFNNRVHNSRVADAASSTDKQKDHQSSSLLHDGTELSKIAPFLGSLKSYIYDDIIPSSETSSSENHSPSQKSLRSAGIASTPTQKSGDAYCVAYLNLLRFLCQPLAEVVNSQKERILAEYYAPSVFSGLCSILEAFNQFCYISLSFQSREHRKGQGADDGCDFNKGKNVLAVSLAAFILAIKTKHDLHKTMDLFKLVIFSDWIRPEGLKYLNTRLDYIGGVLYDQKQLSEASKALKFCCRAGWASLRIHCQNRVQGDPAEDDILDSVKETCRQTVFLLDVLSQCESMKIHKRVVESLESWSVVEELSTKVEALVPIVKQWVKIQCELSKSMGVDYSAPTLHCLLGSSARISISSIGKLLQQELLVYERMENTYPEFSQKMLLKIIDILLQDVYVRDEDCLERSRILLRKGRALRANPDQALSNSIQCASEAISVLMSGTMVDGSSVSHQLAMAHSLRALCIQEAEPSSKEVIRDIEVAINLWLSIPQPNVHDNGCSIMGDQIYILCNIADLLAIKGFTELNRNIYRLMIRFFEWRNVPIGKCFSFLWGSRRLSHGLCISPIDEAFLTDISCNSEKKIDTMAFWLNCLEASMPLLAGFQLKLSYCSSCSSSNNASCSQLDVAVDVAKRATSDLISDGTLNRRSAFMAAILYYDLCERLAASGQLVEAVSCAKQAYKLRFKLFQDNFTYQDGKCGERLDPLQKAIKDIRMHKSTAIEIWSSDRTSQDVETYYLSPWKVLQCYLESTLQVAVVLETIGHGIEAESFLLWGKEISCSLSLPVFTVAFSTVLGKIYCEKGSWDQSEEELQCAKEILSCNDTAISCSKCRLMLEVSVNQQLGDLTRSRLIITTKDVSHELLSLAEGLYTSALDKLNEPEWKNVVSCPEKVEKITEKVIDCYVATCPEEMSSLPSKAEPEVKKRVRRPRQTRNAQIALPGENLSEACHNTRVTRSRCRSLQHTVDGCVGSQAGISQVSESKSACTAEPSGERVLLPEGKGCKINYEGVCICNNTKCCNCLSLEVHKSGSVSQFIQMRWEFARRRLSVGVFNGIGMCKGIRDQNHEEHKVSLQSLSVLLCRNPFRSTQISDPPTDLLNLMVKEFFRNTFAVQIVEVLYNLCLLTFKSYYIKGNRLLNVLRCNSPDINIKENPFQLILDELKTCCNFSSIELPEAVHWLMEAFVLCREVPYLLKKVSRLLSAIYIISTSKGLFSLPSCNKVLSESHWASYFHQASLGTHLNYQFFINKTQKIKPRGVLDGQDISAGALINAESYDLPRVGPASVDELENFVTEFFADLPNTTIICISLISDSLTVLLQELMAYPPDVKAWLLLSRLNSTDQPLVTLLPLYSSLEVTSGDDSGAESVCSSKKWHCPWGTTVIDEVAPVFRNILETSYLTSSTFPREDSIENRNLWWNRRKRLDCQLDEFLRSIEDKWFGSWRILLSAGLSNSKQMDVLESRLIRELKSKCKVVVNQILLKAILGAEDGLDAETCIKQLFSLKKGCAIGQPGSSDKGKFAEDSEAVKRQTELAVNLLCEARNKVKELQEQISVSREPAILVLDHEVQMLPWESIPTLRSQEIYRLPTLGSISWILDMSLRNRESAGTISAAFPFIDPLDAFYLLNPSGDLNYTQAEFEKWFHDKKFEGKAGSAPPAEELAVALKSHDLYIYLGHGSGEQYISGGEIQKLEKCAATLLMGCSSGSLSLTGSYMPKGAPLYYLQAGSPVVVSNLWEVTDKDIDRFCKAMLNSWLQERSNACTDSLRENLAKEFESINIGVGAGKGKKKAVASKKKALKPEECDNGRPTIGSFMAQAREACKLKYLIGAAPVCYGVPTSIRRKNTTN